MSPYAWSVCQLFSKSVTLIVLPFFLHFSASNFFFISITSDRSLNLFFQGPRKNPQTLRVFSLHYLPLDPLVTEMPTLVPNGAADLDLGPAQHCWVPAPWHHLTCLVLLHMLRHFGCRNGSVAVWSLPSQLLSQGG